MRKSILLVVFSLFMVSGCATVETITPDTYGQRVFAASNAFNTLLAGAVVYESLPRCAEGESPSISVDTSAPSLHLCSDTAFVEKLRSVANNGAGIVEGAEDLVLNSPPGTLDDVSILASIEGAEAIVTRMKSMLAAVGWSI